MLISFSILPIVWALNELQFYFYEEIFVVRTCNDNDKSMFVFTKQFKQTKSSLTTLEILWTPLRTREYKVHLPEYVKFRAYQIDRQKKTGFCMEIYHHNGFCLFVQSSQFVQSDMPSMIVTKFNYFDVKM